MSRFSQPFQVGSLTVSNRTLLAPLAGVSDIPFRRICQEQGAGLTYVEMLSATAINYRNKKTFDMMARHKSEKILGVQVTGPNGEEIAKAIETLSGLGFETIDINMGCPVRKVVSAGCGSALIKETAQVVHVAKLARQSTSLPLSIKCRIGYTREDVNIERTANAVAGAEVDMFTVHGRTRSESYNTPVDFKSIALGLRTARQSSAKNISVVGNGDVFGWESALDMQQETEADAVMVSRGALGNPWVFREILDEKIYQPTFEEWFDVVMRHVDYHEEHYGNTRLAAILLRKHLLWYAKGFPHSKAVREQLNSVESLESIRSQLHEYYEKTDKKIKRFENAVTENITSAYDPKYEMDRTLDRGVGDEGM